jgi:hypothetical protein
MTVDFRNLSADKDADCIFQSSSSQNITAHGGVPAWSFGKRCHREWLVLTHDGVLGIFEVGFESVPSLVGGRLIIMPVADILCKHGRWSNDHQSDVD